MRSLLLLLCFAGIARAGEHDATFAQHIEVKPAAVREVVGYELPAGGDYTHVLAGRYEADKYTMAGVVLLHCDAGTCEGRRADFGAAETIEIAGVVDLDGAAEALPSRGVRASGQWTKLRGGRAKWPALVVRTSEKRPVAKGTETRTRLYLISLADADRASVVLQDTAVETIPKGAGFARTYRLEKSEDGKRLEIIATERASGCAKPAEIRFKRDGRHFKAVLVERESC